MVRLTRIYTRGGDTGETSLGDGKRVSKTHPRIAVYGTVDELNAVLGVATQQAGLTRRDRDLLRLIQNDLFDVGADLCVPLTKAEQSGARLRIVDAQVERLEAEIDWRNDALQPLTSFVLPGGSAAAAWLHVARTVCRRAELGVALLAHRKSPRLNPVVMKYLNRLSDLLFVMARHNNRKGRADVLWLPGASRGGSKPLTRSRKATRAQPTAPRKSGRRKR